MAQQTVGPEHGSLTLHTGVEGKAAKAGHALTLLVQDWSATVTFEGTEPTAVSLRAKLDSIEVVSGEGGLKPLSDRDKRSVLSSAMETLEAAAHPEVAFEGSSLSATEGGYELVGDVTMHGTTAPLTAELAVRREDGGAFAETSVSIEQTRFGIKPYRGMMGALRVSDRVEIRLAVSVPAAT